MIELNGHKYSPSMVQKYYRGIAWICSNDSCKRLHTSKHPECKDCRIINCVRCGNIKVIASKRYCHRCEARNG